MTNEREKLVQFFRERSRRWKMTMGGALHYGAGDSMMDEQAAAELAKPRVDRDSVLEEAIQRLKKGNVYRTGVTSVPINWPSAWGALEEMKEQSQPQEKVVDTASRTEAKLRDVLSEVVKEKIGREIATYWHPVFETGFVSDAVAIEAMARVSSPTPPTGEWQDINTAPRDGTPVLLYAKREGWDGYARVTGAFVERHWNIYGCAYGEPPEKDNIIQCLDRVLPLLWMPLPIPPKGPTP